jgi:hypothetical protein
VQVRYYNTSAVYRLFSVQHRSHRKLLIIDEATVLTGGRNIANDYFDLSDHYNFLDSDLEVTGPIVTSILQSFDLYWNSRLAAEPALDTEPNPEAAKFVVAQPGDVALLARLRAAGESYRQSHQSYECRDLRFVTDFPNQGEKSRNVFNAIVDELRQAKQNPAAILSGGLLPRTGVEGAPGRRYGVVDVPGIPIGHAGHDFLRGRIDHVNPTTRMGRDEPAVDIERMGSHASNVHPAPEPRQRRTSGCRAA